MPKYDGIISLYIRDLEAADDQEAAERVEDYKELLAEHAELSWPEWDFSLTHADSEPTK
jgi:8-oxo-dGTP pyrophosphatase MutT (NUDIX family)